MAGVNGIEIKVGQVWRQRDGRYVRVARREQTGCWGTVAHEDHFAELADITDDGRCEVNTAYDLIELVQDENGFTIWRGGECPVPAGSVVELVFRNAAADQAIAEGMRWAHTGQDGDIVAYKVLEHQPASAPKDMAADMLSDLGWHFDGTTWVQDGESASVETPDSALAVQVGGSHYKDLAIQPIEYIHANKLGFCEGNVVKYITRHRQKHGADDIRKVIHYCQLLLELEYGGAK